MQLALVEARKAADEGEIPIGAVLVHKSEIVARAHNAREKSKNPLHHAEMAALEEGGKRLDNWRLSETTLYVTLEPCLMCLGAVLQARVGGLVFGCTDPKRASAHLFPSLSNQSSITANNHTLQITGGILENECAALLKDFFETKREKKG
ncbi:MAG: nucleoside deaminase [Deltaproteobacteria bacterium]|nr:nucleoside deaminase [Deltaproteobacteria bacterium]